MKIRKMFLKKYSLEIKRSENHSYTDVQFIQSDSTVADLLARVQRLEGQNRQLTGQLEEAMNLMRRSQDEFKRYREDTEFRLQALEGGGGGTPKAPAKKVEAAPPVAAPPKGPPHRARAGAVADRRAAGP